MALIMTLTDYGEQRRAQNLIDDSTFRVVKIKAGAGHVATAAAARALTDIVTPFVPVRENDNPQGVTLANDPVAQFRYQDTASVNYEIKEFGVFVSGGMTHYACDDGGATLAEKTPQLALDQHLYFTVTSGDQAAFTFASEMPAPLATNLTPGLVRRATAAGLVAWVDAGDHGAAMTARPAATTRPRISGLQAWATWRHTPTSPSSR